MLDYVNYKLRRCKYSDEELQKKSYQRGDRCPKHTRGLKAGDTIVIHTTDSFISWLIMYYTDSHASHVCLYLQNGMVFDFVPQGARFHPITDYFNSKYWVVVCRPRDEMKGPDFEERILRLAWP